MANPTEADAAHTEAGEGLTEAERRRIEDWLHDNRWPEAYDLSHAIRPVVEQIIRDRQAPIEALADDLIREGDRNTRRRAYPTGVALRYAGNRLHAALRGER